MRPEERPEHDARHIDYPESYPHGTVVLVSGGIDSLLNGDMFPDATLLYVHLGHLEAEREERACRALFQHRINVVRMRGIPPAEGGRFMPARNLLLCCAAVHYGSEIVFGAMADDHSVDKTPAAFRAMEQLLSAQAGRDITIRTPWMSFTKHGAVAKYLQDAPDLVNRARSVARLLSTWSCYGMTTPYGWRRCMDCKNCFRWYAALRFNGIPYHGQPSPRMLEWGLSEERLAALSQDERDCLEQVFA